MKHAIRLRNHHITTRLFPFLVLLMLVIPFGTATSQGPTHIEFVVDEFNPYFDVGVQPGVDDEAVLDPYILEHDGLFHMFYVTRNDPTSPLAISYATSEDSIEWNRYEGNPIFEGDGEGFDLTSVLGPVVLVEDGTWIMYYAGLRNLGVAFGDGIGRATASDPTGPWERTQEPLITIGEAREWDANKIGVDEVFATDEGYMLYYTSNQGSTFAIGMATSTDGLTWQKYNDPATEERKYINSDPVFAPSERGNWDDGGVSNPAIRRTDDGYEMVYLGSTNRPQPDVPFFDRSLGYAYSEDGIHWTRYADNPIHITPTEVTMYNPAFLEANDQIFIVYALLEQTNNGPIGGRLDRAELIVTQE